ncbi:MAG: trehalase-like domain-containing protein, partial [Acidimicrobiales bacterium]
MTSSARREGFAPIADYAVLGDGRTVALVASDGQVDWWPIPTLDSPPACAAILDPDAGGRFTLAPEASFGADRRYVLGTNVLESTYTTSTGTARVTDSLNAGSSGRLPWTELARRVEGLTGHVDLRWELVPGNRFGCVRPWIKGHGSVPVVTLGDQTLALVVQGCAQG